MATRSRRVAPHAPVSPPCAEARAPRPQAATGLPARPGSRSTTNSVGAGRRISIGPNQFRMPRQLVENSLTLDINELLRRGALARGSRMGGIINWLDAAGAVMSSISYEADLTNPTEGRLRLRFSVPGPRGGDRRQVDQRVALTTTRPGFGGARWWFVEDGRRAARLHLPPGADQFRSRREYARAAS
jgi:hypothetical protein